MSAEALESAVAAALAGGEAAFVRFLLDNGLGPVWHQALHGYGLLGRFSPASLEALEAARFAAAARYLLQGDALRRIDRLFESKAIAYAAIKGTHVRELAYADPSLRPACDLDLLVPPAQRLAAAAALVEAGYLYQPLPDTASHEASFASGGVHIDLHWDLFRPGRTRFAMAGALVARRERATGFWGLCGVDAVFLMLTHPAFVNYVCSPNMALCRVMDFALWIERHPVDWGAAAARLEEAGLKTAAWAMLRWFAMLGVAVPAAFVAQLAPGRARARYLERWLELDLPTQWLRRPLLIQAGMTLPLHDRPMDACRAVGGWLRAQAGRGRDPFAQLARAVT